MPFGKYKGVRVRLLPDAYLSWLTTAPMMRSAEWRWLWDSLIAELDHRGLRAELAATDDPVIEIPERSTERSMEPIERKVRKENEFQ